MERRHAATAGNLVFQGTADGRFVAYDAQDRREALGNPDRHRRRRRRRHLSGRRQAVRFDRGRLGRRVRHVHRATDRKGPGTVYTFALGGKAKPPDFVAYQQGALLQGVKYDPAHVKEGTVLYVSNCVFCHGVPGVDRGGNVQNLGYLPRRRDRQPRQVRVQGAGHVARHAGFHRQADAGRVDKIKAFIQGTADAIRPK